MLKCWSVLFSFCCFVLLRERERRRRRRRRRTRIDDDIYVFWLQHWVGEYNGSTIKDNGWHEQERGQRMWYPKLEEMWSSLKSRINNLTFQVGWDLEPLLIWGCSKIDEASTGKFRDGLTCAKWNDSVVVFWNVNQDNRKLHERMPL